MRLTCLAPALIALTACAATPPDQPPAPQMSREVHGAWVVEQARTEPILDKRRARLVLGRDGRLTGHTSCNAMNGSFTLAGEQLKVGAIATTRMACGPLQLEQEDRILTALELAATARVRRDGLLELRDADGRGVLRATRAPEQP
jgi:heat shock protein HslJ